MAFPTALMAALMAAPAAAQVVAQMAAAAAAQALPPAAAASAAAAPAAAQQVTIEGRRAPDELAPQGQLRGTALQRAVSATLGATLADELGVANASFGPGVGLPMVRGQGGSRLRTLVNGLGSNDASTVSADHGAMLESALAERVTIWRGPATIRFGGGAIGGAVEVDDGRVPTQRHEQLRSRGQARLAWGDQQLLVLSADGPAPAGLPLAWHADLHGRRQGLVPIRGAAVDEAAVLRQYQLRTQRNSWGHIDNSQSASEGGALGLAWLGEAGQAGLALSRLRQVYGIPPGGHSHAHTPAPGEVASGGEVRIDARQQRLELRADLDLTQLPPAVAHAGAGQLQLRASASRYGHDEREGPRLSTTFRNDVDELRLEWQHRWWRQWPGTLGLQWQQREFAALGEEAFVPRSRGRMVGLFALQRWQAAPWHLEAGWRTDHQRWQPDASFSVLGQPRAMPARRFWPRSGSLALQRDYAWHAPASAATADPIAPMPAPWAQGSFTLTHWRVGRAPDVQELYAGGPHIATRSFDLGNPGLVNETLQAWDLAWQHQHGAWQWRANAYVYRSAHYIYQRTLGWFYEAEEQQAQIVCTRLDRCLPATKREQSPARFFGHELELARQFRPDDNLRLRLAVQGDAVRGRLDDGSDVPRLPPRRWALVLDAAHGAWTAQWRLTRGLAQDRPGRNEQPTPGYLRLDASLHWTAPAADGVGAGAAQPGRPAPWTAFAVARNLGNQSIRSSTSFLRLMAPEPGRSLELGLEWRL
ncbi:TonB-dependent receptor [Aquabacterium sp. OR-4]|uniref:TonB-dependent receptor n=1 Tax=Aquabacterium sp. OR-4 TaxID=2978127 RepID=UPI0021B1E4E1|nr:TonB-dependent receptor [Aquabacterium sp. OR-4]MDT7836872.1 TonB-dependent receptor [Aquabacterium sp. OR-4]